MLISLAVAFIFTPWLYRRLFRKVETGHAHASPEGDGVLQRVFNRAMTPFLRRGEGRLNRWLMLLTLVVLIALSLALVWTGGVVMKMLPFDNKSEFQVLVDMPEGTPVEGTHRVLQALADHLRMSGEWIECVAGISSCVARFDNAALSMDEALQKLAEARDRAPSPELGLAVRPE